MAILPGTLLPFQSSYPASASRSASSSATLGGGGSAAASGSAGPQDVVSIRAPLPAGSFTAAAGDRFSLRELFDAGSNAWDTVAQYRVALRGDPAPLGGGRLLLRGADVTGRLAFSPAEFNELQFEAGPQGSRQDLVVVARGGTPDGKGGLLGIVDSQPVQISASVTGSRSVEAAAALRSDAGPEDAAFLRVAQEASLYSGLGKTRPALATVGNFTAEAGDLFALRDLYDAGSGAWDSVARYRVALRGEPSAGGRLLLRGVDVTGRVDFTPAEFNELQFQAGPEGTRQDLLVVARGGTPDGKGGLLGIVDSPAVQVTADVTGSRSINAAVALRSAAGADEAGFLKVVQEANLFSSLGKARPELTTVGNFTAEAGDLFSLRELYSAGDSAWDTVARYRVALRGDPAAADGGRLLLRGVDVTGRVDFTPAEFNELQFQAGRAGSRQDLLVVARGGTPDGKGGLTGIVDSPAVQVTASVTGSRSINAAVALRSGAGAEEAGFLKVVQEASLYSGLGKTRPALTTLGNFTAAAGDLFALRDLYDAGSGAWDTVARYRVALRDEPASGAQLLLRGLDVTDRVDFTPAEFNELQFRAGGAGSRQDLVVVARGGTPDGRGGLLGIVDSPAVQVTATVTGSRSVNAAAALRSDAGAGEVEFLKVVQEANLFSGLGRTRPTLRILVRPDDPALSPEALSLAVGSFRSTAGLPGGSAGAVPAAQDLGPLYAGAIGASRVAGAGAAMAAAGDTGLAAALLLLGGTATGGLLVAGDTGTRAEFAARAYLRQG